MGNNRKRDNKRTIVITTSPPPPTLEEYQKEALSLLDPTTHHSVLDNLKTGKNLTLTEERFVRLYATDREFFGNGFEAYVEAFNPDKSKSNWTDVVKRDSFALLKEERIYTRVNLMLEECGFNQTAVDKQLAMLIAQQADLPTKLKAIQEYNKLTRRHAPDLNVNNTLIVNVTRYGDTPIIDNPLPLHAEAIPITSTQSDGPTRAIASGDGVAPTEWQG